MYVREELPEPTQAVENAFSAVREQGREYCDASNYDDLASAAGKLEAAAKWLREEAEYLADEADDE